MRPDGIYFDMPFPEYLEHEALGSTDMKTLFLDPTDYWHGSVLNAGRDPRESTPAQEYGTARHVLVLQGRELFDKIYHRGPDQDPDAPASVKAAITKAANILGAKHGKIVLPARIYDRIVISGAMIMKNPHLLTAFTGGAPEVTIIWTRKGVQRKARIDYLKPRGIGDLKSVTNFRQVSFVEACRWAIEIYRYDIQAAHYLEARAALAEFWKEPSDPFLAFTREQMELLNQCARAPQFAFQWVFIQAEKSPITCSRILSPQNPMVELANQHIDIAADNYRQFIKKYGKYSRWLSEEPPEELDISEMSSRYGRR